MMMKLQVKNRYQAFIAHLGIIAGILLGFLILVWKLWYPAPYFEADGSWGAISILILVNIGIGPLLTLVVYKKGKPGLNFDLAVIAILQILVLLYGGNLVYQERPAFLVFAVDRFTLVSTTDVDMALVNPSILKQMGKAGPVLVYARMPEDKEERSKLLSGVFEGKPDLDFSPKYYEPFPQNISKVLQRGMSLKLFMAGEKNKQAVQQFHSERTQSMDAFVGFPLVGKRKDMLLVLDKLNGNIIGAININPWAR